MVTLINKIPVSVLIPAKNEQANLPACLESVAVADEIFVALRKLPKVMVRLLCNFTLMVVGRRKKTGLWKISPSAMNGF
ncbi:MAG: hypothetical protein RLZZ148_2470 [Cyanobacteriota bacterium]